MALNRIACPECGAGLKSSSGFNPGQTVCCPKCETYFEVEEPADEAEAEEPKKANKPAKATASAGKKPLRAASDDDDSDDEKPRKKKKKKVADDDDDQGSYKNSPLRYVVLGVLVITMCVLGYFLYEKKQKEANDTADNTPPTATGDGVVTPPVGLQGGVPKGNPGFPAPKFPVGPNVPVRPIPKFPNPKVNPVPTRPNPGGGGSPLDLIGGGATVLTPAEAAALVQKFRSQLVGTWKADLGGGKTAEVVYRADGTFTDTLTEGGAPTTIMGTWAVGTLVFGNKGLQINRTVNGARGQVKVVFEDNELLHDTQEKGVMGAFRK